MEMKVFTINRNNTFLLVLVIVLYLLIILYICILLRNPISPNYPDRERSGRGLGWKELLKTWDYNFKLNIKAKEPILNSYPDEVKFILNEVHACKMDLLVLALVVTAIKNQKKRLFIRHTWGHSAVVKRTGIRPLFVVGQSKQHSDQLALEEESRQYHDILQANFIDDYKNLTYKTMAILHWASTYCKNAPVLLKIDDDVIPNPFALSDYLVFYLERNPHPIQILGKLRCCDPVLREGKYAVSKNEYSGGQYPPYVAGPSYIVPAAIIPALLQSARGTRFHPLEDVYTTGVVAKAAGIKHKNILSLTNSDGRKIDIRWCSGARIFQENVGLKVAAKAWNALRKLENISQPEGDVLLENMID
ncbi:beta-1,3-galactosyltransferase 5-like [Palaemon carinicauda]|uniref:beta-1,3-galactosyltransferase 5-like n=1 Tax=Palaemon carinicauda TaxID=392227 RepID=UPI0035B692B3